MKTENLKLNNNISGFDIPAAETSTKTVTGALKEEAALLTVDDNSIAVQQMTVTGRTEGADFINIEKTPVRPENDTGLHIAGGIKI